MGIKLSGQEALRDKIEHKNNFKNKVEPVPKKSAFKHFFKLHNNIRTVFIISKPLDSCKIEAELGKRYSTLKNRFCKKYKKKLNHLFLTIADIDECREGSHLCDHFQNCINTFGGHECRCKKGFELDSTTGSCMGKLYLFS